MDAIDRAKFEKCSAVKLLALLLKGEAGIESEVGRLAVACAVRNRVKVTKSRSYHEVILKPKQYSCFNTGDSNYKMLLKMAQDNYILDAVYENCVKIARLIVEGKCGDITDGANHYYNPVICNPPPIWAKDMEMTFKFGRHEFYRG